MNKCYYPDWEGGFIVGSHNFNIKGECIICGEVKKNKYYVSTDKGCCFMSKAPDRLEGKRCFSCGKFIHKKFWRLPKDDIDGCGLRPLCESCV